ncbi:hypothetical protein BKA70DRAFT_1422633 [Coprinopsis sp. MPI-PUGE-AT-0042]|nr:hypothetical protein BKA70DRAFT_1422633 [Coprinopsis sp. MPI-PUGE-AT-0042]
MLKNMGPHHLICLAREHRMTRLPLWALVQGSAPAALTPWFTMGDILVAPFKHSAKCNYCLNKDLREHPARAGTRHRGHFGSKVKEHRIYTSLLALSPTLEERLCTGSEQELFHIADMISKGASSARSDDTKSLKSVIIDWITPLNGALVPPLQRNIKTDRGFHHPRTGELLCPVDLDWNDVQIREQLRSGELIPTSEQWPRFLYENQFYNEDDPWEGLLRGGLLVSQGATCDTVLQRATSWHENVTIPSIAYIAAQVRFALLSSPVFSRTDLATDSESFYASIITLLEDPEEREEVHLLLAWWDRQVFPRQVNTRPAHEDSVLSKIKERWRRLKELALNGGDGNGD